MRSLKNVLRLGIKELYSLSRDGVMVFLIAYTFTVAIYVVANGLNTEVVNAAIAVVDEDDSELSRRIGAAFLPPHFKRPVGIGLDEIDAAMDAGRFAFVVDIPPDFQADVLAGRRPAVQVNIDATAMTLAGNGANYIANIVSREVGEFVARGEAGTAQAATLNVRAKFNPNLESHWFTAVMQIINNVTILAMILAGAAVIREREHGTIEHLLVMPLTPAQIMLAKIWANGMVIVVASTLSLVVVVQTLLAVPIAGSIGLYALATSAYLFSITALGITLATIARSMPQFGLLAIPVFVVMNMLSGSTTPLDSMPEVLQVVMQAAPSTHFISLAQAVLYRGAGLDLVWPQLAAILGIGVVLFGIALARFRRSLTLAHA